MSAGHRNHLFVIAGPGAYGYAQSLSSSGQCQPAVPIVEKMSPEQVPWEVSGKDVTIKNLGTTDEFAERLIFALLIANAQLVVHVGHENGHVSVHRAEEMKDAA